MNLLEQCLSEHQEEHRLSTSHSAKSERMNSKLWEKEDTDKVKSIKLWNMSPVQNQLSDLKLYSIQNE